MLNDRADELWEASLETLRRHHFRLDRVDRLAGVITTLPITSQHFFELWRHDVDTREDFWEATFNPIRRWVTVDLTSVQGADWTQLALQVQKERMTSPDRQFNSTGAAYQYFGDRLPSTTGLVKVTAEQDRWVSIGRDAAMEEYFLKKILTRAGIEPSSHAQDSD